MKRIIGLLMLAWLLAGLTFACAWADVLSLPAGLTRIEDNAFQGDLATRSVVLPEGIKSIGARAFAHSGLVQINLPKSITSIADDAFEGCPAKLTADVARGSYAHQYCLDHGIKILSRSSEALNEARQRMVRELSDVVMGYADSHGDISPDRVLSAIDAVEAYLQTQYEQGYVSWYAVDKYGATYVDAAKSEVYVWAPRVKGELSGGSDIELTIATYEPFKNKIQDDEPIGQIASAIDAASPHFRLESKHTYANAAVTLEAIQGIGKNQIVIWHGHGGYSRSLNSPFLLTRIKNEGKWGYITELKDPGGALPELYHAIDITDGKEYVALTPMFFKNRLKNLENTFIWLGACEGLKNERIAEALVGNGARAVFGFSDGVEVKYDMDLLSAVTKNLLSVKPGTKRHYTLGEALDKATTRDGVDRYNHFRHVDSKSGEEAEYSAWPIIYPDTDEPYCGPNYSPWFGKIEGTVRKVWDDGRTLPLQNAKIRIKNKGTDVTVTSDSKGKYSCELPAGDYTVTCTHSKYGTRKVENVAIGSDQTVKTDLDYRMQSVSGQVLSAYGEAPLAGATITLKGSKDSASTTTDESGTFQLDTFEEKVSLTISAEHHQSWTGDVELPATGLLFSLEPNPGSITGHVTDALDGSRIAGASLSVRDEWGVLPEVNGSATTDKNGTFTLILPPGWYSLNASADSYLGYDSDMMELRPGQAMVKDIALQPITHTVTFIVEEEVYAEYVVHSGKTVTRPADPTVDGGTFQGWVDSSGEAWSFDTPVTQDIILYAQWKIDWPRVIVGTVFEPVTNRVVPGATVELHRGRREYSYTVGEYNTLVVDGFSSEGYEESPLKTATANQDGHFALVLPENERPTVGSRYIYTLVAKMDGWMTSYTVIWGDTQLPEEGFERQGVPLAPEGSMIHVRGYYQAYQQEADIQHLSPYATTGYITVQRWYDEPWYKYTSVSVYYNDELAFSWSAPYCSSEYWHVCRIIRGRLYSINDFSNSAGYSYPVDKSEADALLNSQLVRPSWLRK